MAVPKSLIRKEKKRKVSKEDEQTSAELSSAHRRLEAKCRQVQTSYIKLIKFLLLALLRSCVQTSLRSVCTHDRGQDSPIQTD